MSCSFIFRVWTFFYNSIEWTLNVFILSKPPVLGDSGKGPDYKEFSPRKEVDDETITKERIEHADVIGKFTKQLLPLLKSKGARDHTCKFLAPGMLHLGLENLAFGATGETQKAFLKALCLDDVIGKTSVWSYLSFFLINIFFFYLNN